MEKKFQYDIYYVKYNFCLDIVILLKTIRSILIFLISIQAKTYLCQGSQEKIRKYGVFWDLWCWSFSRCIYQMILEK